MKIVCYQHRSYHLYLTRAPDPVLPLIELQQQDRIVLFLSWTTRDSLHYIFRNEWKCRKEWLRGSILGWGRSLRRTILAISKRRCAHHQHAVLLRKPDHSMDWPNMNLHQDSPKRNSRIMLWVQVDPHNQAGRKRLGMSHFCIVESCLFWPSTSNL